jgi:2'-5' RNA ligase
VRVFLACCIEPDAAQQLYAALEPLRRLYAGPAYRATPPDNYHVTLRFFGELNQDEVDRVALCVRPVADATARIDCRTTAVLALPSARRPSVIGLSVESAGRLEALASHVNCVLDEDFGPPDKPFKAHLSVIRCRRGARFKSFAADVECGLTFARIALFRSDSADDGPRYSVLREFRLGTGDGAC